MNAGISSASYVYNGDGLRVRKTLNGVTTNYIFDVNGGLPAILDDGAAKDVWGNGLAYLVLSDGTVQAYHGDGVRSIRVLSNAAGSPAQTYQRDAFGVLTATQGPSAQPFDFTGEPVDRETGFFYLRSRYYDPQTGRFISRDSSPGWRIAPGTLSRYAYSSNNPVTKRDPSGHRVSDTGPGGGLTSDPAESVAPPPSLTLGQQIFYGAAGAVGATADDLTSRDARRVGGAVARVVAGTAVAVVVAGEVIVPAAAASVSGAGAFLGAEGGATTVGATTVLSAGAIFMVLPRVLEQLQHPRLGQLVGMSAQRVGDLMSNPTATRLLDARTGNINVVQEVSGVLLRITTAADALRIISVGPMQARQITNGLQSGRFLRLP